MPLFNEPTGGTPRSSRRLDVLAVVGAMLVAAALALPNLGEHLFWDDEANTAIYARNLIRFHRLTAWDGTNLLSYSLGGALGPDLGQELRVPALPAFVAAGSMLLFGETTTAARLPFVLAGIAAVGVLAVWMRRHFGARFPWYVPSLFLALGPAYLLFIRNCRYYAVGVLFSLLVWAIWAPGKQRRGRLHGTVFGPRALARCAFGAIAVCLLLVTHYLNAATALAILPVFFLDRRYRQPRQYVLLAVMATAAALYGGWLLATANPFSANYQPGEDVFGPPPLPGHWNRFSMNLWWFLRDLGTHEFLPWAVVLLLAVPLLQKGVRTLFGDGPTPGRRDVGRPQPAGRLGPARRKGVASSRRFAYLLSVRSATLLAAVLVYAVVAAALLPPDMGKGPTAEMRYVVPLAAVGSAIAGLAVAVCRRLWRPATPLLALLLVLTNWLYLGFLGWRADGLCPWWPPTLYRYAAELCHGYETGNQAAVDLLRKLPPGAAVRIWPAYMIYPPMYYVPELHYCDQLTVKKTIREDLRRELPDYVYVERARPEVVLVPAPFLGWALEDLQQQYGPGKYRVKRLLRPYWDYTTKPELAIHFFARPEGRPRMAVLVAADSPLDRAPMMAGHANDAAVLGDVAMGLLNAGKKDLAEFCLREALRINGNYALARCELGDLLANKGRLQAAVECYRAAIAQDRQLARAHAQLGACLERLGHKREAAQEYVNTLKMRPEWYWPHYKLADLLRDEGATGQAVTEYTTALELEPDCAFAHVNLGAILLQQGRTADAVEHFRAAIRTLPDSVEAHVNLGRAMKEIGDREAASVEFGTALILLPPDSPLRPQVQQLLRDLDR